MSRPGPKAPKTTQQKIHDLYNRFAGDKKAKADELVAKYISEGKTWNRAAADALEKLKLLPKPELAEELN